MQLDLQFRSSNRARRPIVSASALSGRITSTCTSPTKALTPAYRKHRNRRRTEVRLQNTRSHRHRSARSRTLGLHHLTSQLLAQTHVSALAWRNQKEGGRRTTRTRSFRSRRRRSRLVALARAASSAMMRLSHHSPSSRNSMTSRVTVSGRKNGVAVGEFEVLRGCKVKIGTERERERGIGRGVRRSPKKRERNGIGNVFRNRSGTVPEPKRERRTLVNIKKCHDAEKWGWK